MPLKLFVPPSHYYVPFTYRNYFILPELFHVALHSATVFHDEFWEVLIKKIYDILLLADCKFKSSDYTMQIKVLEAMANAYVEDNDGLCVQTLLWVSLVNK